MKHYSQNGKMDEERLIADFTVLHIWLWKMSLITIQKCWNMKLHFISQSAPILPTRYFVHLHNYNSIDDSYKKVNLSHLFIHLCSPFGQALEFAIRYAKLSFLTASIYSLWVQSIASYFMSIVFAFCLIICKMNCIKFIKLLDSINFSLN